MTATRTRERVVRSQVEPRLEQRRRQVEDAEHRRRRRFGIVTGIVLLAIAAAAGAVFSPLLDVDRVQVQGTRRLPVEQLIAASGVVVGDRMVDVDPAEVRDALRQVPGVRSARVERVWPATIQVSISEEEPAARLAVGEQSVVVSTTGRVLTGAPFDAGDLSTLAYGGPLPRDEVPDQVLAATMTLHRMNDQLRTQVESAELTEDGLLSFLLTDGATVRFGPVEDLPAKLGAAEAVLAQVHPECRAMIDVREPSRVTVSRSCEGPAVTDTGVAPEQVDG